MTKFIIKLNISVSMSIYIVKIKDVGIGMPATSSLNRPFPETETPVVKAFFMKIRRIAK